MIFEISFLQKALADGLVVEKVSPRQIVPLRGLKSLPKQVASPYDTKELTLSIDTRTLEPGEVFLALEGARVDGHHFLAEAVEKGARVLIIKESECDRLSDLSDTMLKDVLVLLEAHNALGFQGSTLSGANESRGTCRYLFDRTYPR